MSNTDIGIAFGAMADPLSKQLAAQGFKFDKEKVKNFQKEMDAINRLRFGSHLLSESMVNKILSKFLKVITAHIAKENKLSTTKN